MLRRLDVKAPWRSLDTGFWPEDLPMGSKTIVYGHNGGGKSTLSELLLSLSEDNCATDVIWEDEHKSRIAIGAGGASPSPQMAVFTRKWVEDNLSDFLDGASASAIVTLGKEAIGAKAEEDRLAEQLSQHRAAVEQAEKQHKSASQKVNALAREVQDKIVSDLKPFDYKTYTKNRYTIVKIKDELRKYAGGYPDVQAYTSALRQLDAPVPRGVASIRSQPSDPTDHLAELASLLADTPTRVAIQTLAGDRKAQEWVEQGVALHQEHDRCLFCCGEISNERREQLARHFDASWQQIRKKATILQEVVKKYANELHQWAEGFPAVADIEIDLQSRYRAALEIINSQIDSRFHALEAVTEVLKAKAVDPSYTPTEPTWDALFDPLPMAEIAQVVGEHNDRVRRHAELTEDRKTTVFQHIVGSQSKHFLETEREERKAAEEKKRSSAKVRETEDLLDEARKLQFTTTDMATILTRDLARVYGKNHLSVEVSKDGKSYKCCRGGKPATGLSEGERTTLSLLYFLRKLVDKQTPSVGANNRIVVIDDPSSSLDREALFATHQWLLDTLQDFGQYMILTHDFGLLRLFIKSHKNAWGTSIKKIKLEDENERLYPKVSFLEMFATSTDGDRRSMIEALPPLLLNNTSEYAYLFSAVMNGIENPDDHARLFLLPNAARRVVEVFASYKAPHRSDFRQQLDELVNSLKGEPFRDVYDFCNRYSHGEGGEIVDVLDAKTVHSQIRRCMEFLRAVDLEHFERMCQATKLDPRILS